MDSRTSSQLEHHRRSKSILKKSDSGCHRNGDPESERLISDSTSGIDVGSGSEYSSPSKHLSSPPIKHRTQRTLIRSLPLSSQPELNKPRTLKSPLFLLDDIMSKNKQSDFTIDNKLKQCSDSVRDLPLYICPPPPPMDQSPTEETRLLLHNPSSIVITSKQPNYILRGSDPSS